MQICKQNPRHYGIDDCTNTKLICYLVSSQDLEGVHDLISSVLVYHLTGHKVNKGLERDCPSLIWINLCPQLLKDRVISLQDNEISDVNVLTHHVHTVDSRSGWAATYRIRSQFVAQAKQAGAVFILVQLARSILQETQSLAILIGAR